MSLLAEQGVEIFVCGIAPPFAPCEKNVFEEHVSRKQCRGGCGEWGEGGEPGGRELVMSSAYALTKSRKKRVSVCVCVDSPQCLPYRLNESLLARTFADYDNHGGRMRAAVVSDGGGTGARKCLLRDPQESNENVCESTTVPPVPGNKDSFKPLPGTIIGCVGVGWQWGWGWGEGGGATGDICCVVYREV